jgi:hypothetical protein
LGQRQKADHPHPCGSGNTSTSPTPTLAEQRSTRAPLRRIWPFFHPLLRGAARFGQAQKPQQLVDPHLRPPARPAPQRAARIAACAPGRLARGARQRQTTGAGGPASPLPSARGMSG